MKIAGIRFDSDTYINVTITEDGIEIFTVDSEGNKTEHTVSKKNRNRSKKED